MPVQFEAIPPRLPKGLSAKNVAVVGGCSQQDQPTGDALRGIQADSNSVGVLFVQQQTSSNPSSPLINQPIITTHHPTHHQHIIKNLSFFGFLVFLKGKHFFPIQKQPETSVRNAGLGASCRTTSWRPGGEKWQQESMEFPSGWLDATYHLFFGNQETPF